MKPKVSDWCLVCPLVLGSGQVGLLLLSTWLVGEISWEGPSAGRDLHPQMGHLGGALVEAPSVRLLFKRTLIRVKPFRVACHADLRISIQ